MPNGDQYESIIARVGEPPLCTFHRQQREGGSVGAVQPVRGGTFAPAPPRYTVRLDLVGVPRVPGSTDDMEEFLPTTLCMQMTLSQYLELRRQLLGHYAVANCPR